MIKKFSFSKKFRLLKKNNFQKIFKNSHKVEYKGILILGYVNFLNYPRLGLIISKKIIKKSVHRNKIKRVIREFFRNHKIFFLKMDFIVILKKNFFFEKKSFFLNLKKIWKRYYKKLN